MTPVVQTARRSRAALSSLAVLAATVLTGCPKGEVGDLPLAPNTPPDLNCNTAPDALANAECRLTLGVETKEYIQQRGDKDWWVVNVGQLPANAIVHVTGGYRPGPGQDAGTFNTAVNFQMNALDSNNGTVGTSQVTAKDDHGSNPPTVLDVTFRYSKASNDLFILVQDDPGTHSDQLSPYFIKVEVLADPDVNEPNDTTPTPIPLTGPLTGEQGTQGGYLATIGDVDLFSIQSPGANYVMWIRVEEDPAFPAPPPHRYRLEYFLKDPTGVVVATDSSSAGSLFSQNLVQIGTARLLQSAGTYTLLVRGYIDPNNSTVLPPGDLNFKYKVEVIIVPLQDPSEPNNKIEDAKAKPSPDLTLSPGGSGTITGRISFVPDPDWYRVRLNGDPSGRPHLLHYKVVPSNAPARFPPVPGNKDRVLYVTTEIPNGAQGECAAGDAGVCIISADPNNYNYPIAVNTCSAPTPQCLQSTRYENYDATPKFPNLANFEGVLQVPPHAAIVDYYFHFEDDGTNWADDTDYTIQVDWRSEPDPPEAVPDPDRPTVLAAGEGSTPMNGYLSYGIGATDTSLGIAPITDVRDYDGRGDDVDRFAVTIPAAVTAEQELFFRWKIPSPSLAGMPYDLGMRFAFCVPDGGVACATIQDRTLSGGSQLGLIYSPDPVTSWWNSSSTGIPNEPAYDRTFDMVGGDVITTLRPYACGCLENRLIAQGGGGTMYVSVFPINRQTWNTAIPYTVEAGYGPYPYTFTTVPGGTMATCPTPCQFTRF